jgi:hypothetical protein
VYCGINDERNCVPDGERVFLLVLHKNVCSIQPIHSGLYLKKDEASICYVRERNGIEDPNLDIYDDDDDDDDDDGSNNKRIWFSVNFRAE